jgi:hypothetical protein
VGERKRERGRRREKWRGSTWRDRGVGLRRWTSSLSSSRHDGAGGMWQRLHGGLARNGAVSRAKWRRGR